MGILAHQSHHTGKQPKCHGKNIHLIKPDFTSHFTLCNAPFNGKWRHKMHFERLVRLFLGLLVP